jgi:hypothetical protein
MRRTRTNRAPWSGVNMETDTHPHGSRPAAFPHSRVYYHPLEAAIRWCGLEEHEQRIRESLQGHRLPDSKQYPQWSTLRLNTERIYDAISNRELPCGIDGVTVRSGFQLDHPQLTIRHVDLRTWILRFYPAERPAFLFSPIEQQVAALTFESLKTIVLERDMIRASLQRRDEQLCHLRDELAALRKAARPLEGGTSEALSLRGEATYLHIIGALLRLLMGHSPAGIPYSNFKSQESVISALLANFGGELMGITERTLHAKFAAANRAIEDR